MRKFICIILAIICIASFCSLAACEKKLEDESGSVTITNKVTALEQGDEYTFTVQTEGVSEAVVWTSSDSAVIQMDGAKAICKKGGIATVTATIGSIYDSVTVTVSDDYRPEINTRESQPVNMFLNGQYRANPVVVYKGEDIILDMDDYSYKSSDETIATVDKDGYVTGQSIGEADITISANYRFFAIKASYTVVVSNESYVSTDKPVYRLTTLEIAGSDLKTQEQINATVVLDGEPVSNSAVTYATDDHNIVNVSSSGVITAVSAGFADITVSFVSGSLTLKVNCIVEVVKQTVTTALHNEYVVDSVLTLPEYEIDDFKAENVIAVYCNGVNVYTMDKKLDKQLVIGSPNYQNITVETSKCKYVISTIIYNAKIASKQDLDGVNARLARFPVSNRENDGYFYDGYIAITADIAYNGTFEGIVSFDDLGAAGENNGFKGVIDGNGHTISGLRFETEKSAFVYSLIDGGIIMNLNFEDCVTYGLSTAVVAVKLGDANLIDISVKGKMVSRYIPSALTQSRGLVIAEVFENGAKIEGVYAEAEVVPSMNYCALFGFLNGVNDDGLFENCTAVNSGNKLYGVQGSGENQFDVKFLNNGITNYVSYFVYLTGELGYTYSAGESSTGSCVTDGIEVYKKTGLPDRIITTPASGHSINDGHCENCNLSVVEKNLDCDTKDGIDFDMLVKGYDASDALMCVTLDGAVVELEGERQLNFTKEDASLNAMLYQVTTEKHIYNLSVTVWSLIISNEVELKAMNDYLVINRGYPTINTSATGYYMLDADIVISEDITKTNRAFYSLGYDEDGIPVMNVVFDGANHRISNWVATDQMCSLLASSSRNTIVRNLKIEGTIGGPFTSNSKGLIVSRNCGGLFENIDAELTFTYKSSQNANGAALLGSAFGSWVQTPKIVVRNLTVKSGNETISAAEDCYNVAIVAGFYCETHTFKDKKIVNGKEVESAALTLEDVIVVGFHGIVSNTYSYSPLDYTVYTGDELEDFCYIVENVEVYESLEEYEQSIQGGQE